MHLASRLVQNDHTDRTRRPFYPLDKRYRAGGVPRIGVDFLNDRPRSAEADFFWALSSRTPWKARPRRLKMAGQDGLRTAPATRGPRRDMHASDDGKPGNRPSLLDEILPGKIHGERAGRCADLQGRPDD
jgi:hypothetical protein